MRTLICQVICCTAHITLIWRHVTAWLLLLLLHIAVALQR
jgi:hypothetical protein